MDKCKSHKFVHQLNAYGILTTSFAHADIVVLVVDSERNHVFSGGQLAGKIAERFRFRIDDPIFGNTGRQSPVSIETSA